jgi:hypothetical protein
VHVSTLAPNACVGSSAGASCSSWHAYRKSSANVLWEFVPEFDANFVIALALMPVCGSKAAKIAPLCAMANSISNSIKVSITDGSLSSDDTAAEASAQTKSSKSKGKRAA